jgi:eukaryotic-like serine/threonine-protein kinase
VAGSSTFIVPSSPLERRRLGKYDVVCRLSTGGMSQIYLAQQHGMGGFHKLVVLKTILPDIVGEEDFVRMFLDEARTTAGFNHPHIAQVFELETADDVLFMAMEFVQGCTLVEMARACRQAREPIPIGLTLAAVRDTALALHYAHNFVDPRGRRQVVIHRDVAEKNIMVTYEGVTKLLDFGIAKALGKSGRTSAGMVKGTSGYMSPEQIRGEPLDPRSDLFSLGVVLHECLTGLRLFHGKNAEEGMLAALKGEVAPPSRWNALVRPEIDAVVLKALAKDRDARYGSALEMARAIERSAPGAIWHPEQSGELVLRHFSERRAETRRVLEDAFGAGTDGSHELRVQSLISRMKGAQAPPPPLLPTLPGRRVSPPEPQPDSAPSPEPVLPPAPAPAPAPAPLVGAAGPRSRESSTDRYEALSPRAATPTPTPADEPDDASEAKTLPAATLPEEIKAIRRRLQEEEARRQGAAARTITSTRPEDAAPLTEPVRLKGSRPSGASLKASPGPRASTGETASLPPRAAAPGGLRGRAAPSEPELSTVGRADPGDRAGRLIWIWVGVGGLVAGLTLVWLLLGH